METVLESFISLPVLFHEKDENHDRSFCDKSIKNAALNGTITIKSQITMKNNSNATIYRDERLTTK